MDRCFLERLFLIWTLVIRLGGFCFEITVRHSELKPCEGNDRICVTDPTDCKPPPPSPSQKMLNMSCSYQQPADGVRSVTCSWSQEAESRASLVFTSGSKVFSCLGIFSPAAVLGSLRVTARMRSYLTGTDEWAQPQFLRDAVKTSRPDLTPTGSESVIRSDWSGDTTVRTLDRVPSRPAEMCYRVEKTGDDEFLLLHLVWMGSGSGRVLGYQVRIDPNQHLQNVTETTFLLVVKEGNYSATVRAFNTAGFGPATRLQINTQDQNSRLSVRNLWISSHYPENEALQVQWATPTTPPGGHVLVHWRSEENPSNSRWVRVNGSSSSAVITGVDPEEPYLVSVFPVYNQRCGSAQSLNGSLENGALMEVVGLKVVNVTKTTVTVAWAWQRKPAPIRVDRYRATLRRDADTQTLSLWPDQQQHTFSKLTPSTEYSLLLLADNVSRFIIPVATQYDEAPAVTTVTLLLLLVVTVMIISVLSRTVYKSYFFPTIPSARRSTAGQWLLNPDLKKCSERNFLDVSDFQVTDVLGQKQLILVCPNHLQKDQSPTSSLSVKLDTVDIPGTKPITGHAWDVRPITEQQLLSLQSGFRAEMGGAKVPLLQEQEESGCSHHHHHHHHHHHQAFMFRFPELLTDFLEQPEPVTGPLEPVPEVEYLTNGCFRAEPAAGSEPSVLH
ncbi:interleukin-6 receptor subunit beta [Poeciliopsis prolifica]|uniref:interleukin-6 receptor subunit beta n=1 Tax=Poeciliopsis prolifica TaxID=188132 RepID=UPI002413222A|nr:interleukin-6 receptor subunit beta [Poeciliopsis prolifica]